MLFQMVFGAITLSWSFAKNDYMSVLHIVSTITNKNINKQVEMLKIMLEVNDQLVWLFEYGPSTHTLRVQYSTVSPYVTYLSILYIQYMLCACFITFIIADLTTAASHTILIFTKSEKV